MSFHYLVQTVFSIEPLRLDLKIYYKAAITHNEINEGIAITARKTIITVVVTMSLKRFSAVWCI